MKINQYFLFILIAFVCFSCNVKQPETIDLSGEWQFQMDPDDAGENEKWYEKDFPETVKLPSSMVENGKGYDITLETKWTGGVRNPEWYNDPNYAPYHDSTNIRFPYWLQPDKKYTGAAWYRKKVSIPENWTGKSVLLKLERPHWESTVWVNNQKVQTQNSLASPHLFNISEFLQTGENTITVRIDNRTKNVDVGQDSHSISDHTQSNWNGIAGKLLLQAKGDIYYENIEVFPDVERKTVEIRATIFSTEPEKVNVKIPVVAILKKSAQKSKQETFEFTLSTGVNTVKMSYPLGEDALLWDEFQPNIYELFLEIKTKKVLDRQTVDFGMREFKVDGTRFAINGRPVFLRGTLECAIFPKTGYPPTENAGWEKVFSAVKAHGLNHVRFHSWCPPEAAFSVADSMGVYLQVECSSWANSTTELGSGFPVDQYIWDESKRIVKAYGNHPSFVMLAYGNEPGGPKYAEFLTEFVSYWKKNDPRRIYTGAAGWPALAVNDYHNLPAPRIQGWGEELRSIINAEPPKTDYDWSGKVPVDGIPVVSHEIGQWCVYPNFKEIEKYTGPLKAKNFEIFRESLIAHNMGNLADSFLLASGKLQALCYKADIEAALRTPGFAGFQLLDLHDFPGQGTALVGVLDPFWEEKGYITPQEYSRFCNSTVPLARLKKMIFTEGDTMTAGIEVAHFGQMPLKGVNPTWKLTQNDKTVAEGTLGQQDIPIVNAISLGKVVYQFQKENHPRKMTLEIGIENFSNSWDIWIYPETAIAENNDIKVVEKLDAATLKFLQNGGKVLLSLGQGKVSPEMGGKVGVGFSSIFWNTAWTGGQKPHTLGILCNPNHPALELFPTEYHSNWQWQDAMSHADAIQLDSFPVELKPIVRIIDDWVSNRQLAMIFEAKVGNGKLLVSGADLVNNLESRPEARQLKTSLLNYMKKDMFTPKAELTVNDIQKIGKY
ncbi:MAG TPA: glycoside hydrolase family 2 TIM barrel-domain containing protein [Draconibacterium sp.]|nr:glycoside hydrolase family 2 TIM barrel-domain containing protein [Draconibacterium sp.]